MKLTLGDTTLTLYLTPGPHRGHDLDDHSGARRQSAARRGGVGRHAVQLRPESAAAAAVRASAARFRDIAAKAGADVILSNHTVYDGSKTKLPARAGAQAGRAASVRRRQRCRAAVSDRRERVRAGGAGEACR